MSEEADQEWLSIIVVENEEHAELIEGFLRSEGIPAQLDSKYSHEFPAHVGSLGQVEVLVPADRADEAKRLVDEREAAFRPSEESAEPGS
jgi:Putative prokaryotic signal transducing protein